MSNVYGTLLGGGAIVGSLNGLQAQYHGAKYDDRADSPKGYTMNALKYSADGAIMGSGIYGFNKIITNSLVTNKSLAGAIVGVGTGIGALKGINSQIYASKHYNTPEFGPGEARADIHSLALNACTEGIRGAVTGLGVVGALEVAQQIMKRR